MAERPPLWHVTWQNNHTTTKRGHWYSLSINKHNADVYWLEILRSSSSLRRSTGKTYLIYVSIRVSSDNCFASQSRCYNMGGKTNSMCFNESLELSLSLREVTVINSNKPILNKIYGIKTPKLDVFTLPFDSRSHHSLRFFPEPSPYKVHSDGPGSGDGSILPYVSFANRGSLSSWFWIITSLSTLLRPLPDRKVHQLQLIALISRT